MEKPHNSIHVLAGGRGGPMSSVSWAAFDVVFWLHHCNVDRIYEAYIQIEKDSHDEFEAFQRDQHMDRFQRPLEPFKKDDGSDFFPTDTFDTRNFGFVYDRVPQLEARALTTPPTLALFEQIRVTEFDGKCYAIHVFVCGKEEEARAAFMEQVEACATIDEILDLEAYAGSGAIFGRGLGCSTCRDREPFDLMVDVSDALRRLALGRSGAALQVLCEETTSDDADVLYVKGEDTAGLPAPRLVGPLFDASEEMVAEGSERVDEVDALQKYLQAYGYYDGKMDSDFGPRTAQAVRDFQTAAEITVDAVAGPETKGAMTKLKRCANKDAFAENEVRDQPSDEAREALKGRTDADKVTYSVATSPGYLVRADVLAAIKSAFDKWAAACALEFEYVDDPDAKVVVTSPAGAAAAASDEKAGDEDEDGDGDGKVESVGKADLVLAWSPLSQTEANPLRFDGPGGVLGRGGNGFVVFDVAERWATDAAAVSDLDDPSTYYRGQPVIDLYYTALHEIGHTLGLDHSRKFNEVMSPFYTPSLTDLQPGDVERIQALYGPNGGAPPAEEEAGAVAEAEATE